MDHVCTGRRFRRSLQDFYVQRRADVASDHHLLVAKLTLKLKRNWTGDRNQRQRYDTNDTSKQQVFKIGLFNKFHILEEQTINEKWQAIKESFTLTCGSKKSNTIRNGSQLRPSKRSNREKEKRQTSTTVLYEHKSQGL